MLFKRKLRPTSVMLAGGSLLLRSNERLEVGVDRTPFRDCGNDAEGYDFEYIDVYFIVI